MKFNDFVTAAFSNDLVCIVEDVYEACLGRGKIICEPTSAWQLIGSEYAVRDINRFTIFPREYSLYLPDGTEIKSNKDVIVMSLKQ